MVTVGQMMQNAGRAIFDVVMKEVLPKIAQPIDNEQKPPEGGQSLDHPHDIKILIVAGKGNNGGDALVSARFLLEQGIDVHIFTPFVATDFTPMGQ